MAAGSGVRAAQCHAFALEFCEPELDYVEGAADEGAGIAGDEAVHLTLEACGEDEDQGFQLLNWDVEESHIFEVQEYEELFDVALGE